MTEIRLPSFNDFSPVILQGDLQSCLAVIRDSGGDDQLVHQAWAKLYFDGEQNKRSTTNIPATLRSTGLRTDKRPLTLSVVGNQILDAASKEQAAIEFCAHLLREKNCKLVIEALNSLTMRKIPVTKASLKQELMKLGVTGLSNNTTDHSTFKNWLIHSGLVSTTGAPIDAKIKAILGISGTEIDEFKSLSLGQQVFLHLLRKQYETASGPFPVNHLLRECMTNQPHLFDEAQFAKKVRTPLIRDTLQKSG
jgi:hypothetical protein